MDELVSRIQQNYSLVKEKIRHAAISMGRDPQDVLIVTVSKSQPIEVVKAAVSAGIHIFGENYAEEAVEKIESLKTVANLEWHMIGHVQSRKSKLVAAYFDRLESLDNLSLAQKMESLLSEKDAILPCLLEFNIANEITKSGWNAADEEKWDPLFDEIVPIFSLPHIQVDGIMVMPPLSSDVQQTRQYFRKSMHLFDELRRKFPIFPGNTFPWEPVRIMKLLWRKALQLSASDRRFWEHENNDSHYPDNQLVV